jgi:16S rRNA (adenine1518-N6/adenine1519-N6)-dimethyltransferase
MAHKARKRFGQNFLQDQYYQFQIADSLQLQQPDHWVEIGPGQGAITDHIAGQCDLLELIELDRDLVAMLEKRYYGNDSIKIYSQDALSVDFCALVKTNPVRLVGNLPYNISTPLIFHFLKQRECIQDAHFLLQKEVVDRMVAVPGEKAYGKLSVMIQQAFQVLSLFDIPPEAFHPAPKVQSSFVRLTPHLSPIVDVDDQAVFADLVKMAFVQKRKTLHNNLKTIISDDALKSIDINPSCRAETLTLEQFAAISNLLGKQ